MPRPTLPSMAWSEALAVLGLSTTFDEAAVRSAYRSRLRATHPDLSDAHDATERTVRLTTAYRTVLARLHDPGGLPVDGASAAADTSAAADAAMQAPVADVATGRGGAGPRDPDGVGVLVALSDTATISVTAPAGETLALLIDAAHRLGDIAYLDRSAGLLEVIVEFVGEPTSSVVLSLQGRATGVTEVFCTVEPLSGGDAPPSDAVTRLLLRTLRGEDPAL